MGAPDQRGFAKSLQAVLPISVFRPITVIYNTIMSKAPYGLKYPLGSMLRRHKYPYRVIKDGDVVVQVGAPRDILHAGRSRALHFARMVGRGKAMIIEPDKENVTALKEYATANGLAQSVVIVEMGAWKEKATLKFFSSPNHPASNLLEGVTDISQEQKEQRGYQEVNVSVDTIDDMLERAGLYTPKLVSVTTNGAELQILDGMKKTLAAGVEYISLASTGEGFFEYMDSIGFEYIARDDRGYCFRKKDIADK